MWYMSGCNGGLYHWVKWEYPVPEITKVIEYLRSINVKFKVECLETEHGYSGEMMLINDETLETIYVDRYIHGHYEHWTRVCADFEDTYNYVPVWISQYNLSEVYQKAANVITNTKVQLCLPSETQLLAKEYWDRYTQLYRHSPIETSIGIDRWLMKDWENRKEKKSWLLEELRFLRKVTRLPGDKPLNLPQEDPTVIKAAWNGEDLMEL